MKYHYYIYCDGILGVKTNVKKFRWVYGSVAPSSSYEKYEECKVKFDIRILPEKELSQVVSCDKRFQSYSWNEGNRTLSYRRTFFNFFKIGYNMKIEENVVSFDIGENYFRFIKNRVMNLHGTYYLLSDIANIVLLSNGLLTLYASVAHNTSANSGVVCFGAPNTGKTLTAVKLSETRGYSLIGEDVVIFDGNKVYSCPWTASYRGGTTKTADSSGSGKRKNMVSQMNFAQSCELTDVAILSLGKEKIEQSKECVYKMSSIINGYLFNYYSTPIVKVLGLFDDQFCVPWQEKADEMLKDLFDRSNCFLLQYENASMFADELHHRLLEKKI